MDDHIYYHHRRHHKKPLWRRILAWLGIRHIKKRHIFFYFLALIILIFLFPFFLRFLTSLKENFATGYGYVPRDTERFEKLKREGKPIPFQPKGTWIYDKNRLKKRKNQE